MLGMAGPRRPVRHAIEVRHPSFETPAFAALLREHDVAVVVADTAGKWPFLDDVTAGFVYVRLHGDKKLYESGYTVAALEQWAARLRDWARNGDVFVYFDNDIKVKAPRDAMRLAAMLGVAWTPADDPFAGAKGRAKGPLRPERRRNPWTAGARSAARPEPAERPRDRQRVLARDRAKRA
jgi:hypothetical protein